MKYAAVFTVLALFLSQNVYAGAHDMPHVTGIGGVFFKAKDDRKALSAWYQQHLGITLEPYGAAVFRWPQDKAGDGGATAWMIAEPNSTWFDPSPSGFMINYRVDDLDGLVANLKSDGVALTKDIEVHDNGKFAWLLDPDGNLVELWEPKASSTAAP